MVWTTRGGHIHILANLLPPHPQRKERKEEKAFSRLDKKRRRSSAAKSDTKSWGRVIFVFSFVVPVHSFERALLLALRFLIATMGGACFCGFLVPR
jgi:hypothetical protein